MEQHLVNITALLDSASLDDLHWVIAYSKDRIASLDSIEPPGSISPPPTLEEVSDGSTWTTDSESDTDSVDPAVQTAGIPADVKEQAKATVREHWDKYRTLEGSGFHFDSYERKGELWFQLKGLNQKPVALFDGDGVMDVFGKDIFEAVVGLRLPWGRIPPLPVALARLKGGLESGLSLEQTGFSLYSPDDTERSYVYYKGVTLGTVRTSSLNLGPRKKRAKKKPSINKMKKEAFKRRVREKFTSGDDKFFRRHARDPGISRLHSILRRDG